MLLDKKHNKKFLLFTAQNMYQFHYFEPQIVEYLRSITIGTNLEYKYFFEKLTSVDCLIRLSVYNVRRALNNNLSLIFNGYITDIQFEEQI